MENIKEIQRQEQESFYQDVKKAILDDIKSHIRNKAYVNFINYNKNTFVLIIDRRHTLPDPIRIYGFIENNYDRLSKELKEEESIQLIKTYDYEHMTKGFFKKTEYKILKDEYYKITW